MATQRRARSKIKATFRAVWSWEAGGMGERCLCTFE